MTDTDRVTAGQLVAALKNLSRAYVSLLETARDRIISLGGECDPVDVMEQADPALRSVHALLQRIQTKSGGVDG